MQCRNCFNWLIFKTLFSSTSCISVRTAFWFFCSVCWFFFCLLIFWEWKSNKSVSMVTKFTEKNLPKIFRIENHKQTFWNSQELIKIPNGSVVLNKYKELDNDCIVKPTIKRFSNENHTLKWSHDIWLAFACLPKPFSFIYIDDC